MRIMTIAAALALGLTACGGGEPTEEAPPVTEQPSEPMPPAPAPTLSMPSWMQVDNAARTVSITVEAGATNVNNYWNYNGFFGGAGGITVPQGFTVTINLVNRDPAMAHSLGISERMATYPNQFPAVTPAFAGAVTQSPQSMTESTLPGETETVTFVADRAGDFVMVCYVTGHAATGMWVNFTVSTDGTVGAFL